MTQFIHNKIRSQLLKMRLKRQSKLHEIFHFYLPL
jgi:hypothetical protein